MKCLAIIPARGGSKRIPHKNIKPLLGNNHMGYEEEEVTVKWFLPFRL